MGWVVDMLLNRDRQGQIAEVNLLPVPTRLPPSAISLERHEARYRVEYRIHTAHTEVVVLRMDE